eukprot:Nk52_evm28s2612 gene=Nk52_evmTU28s2612
MNSLGTSLKQLRSDPSLTDAIDKSVNTSQLPLSRSTSTTFIGSSVSSCNLNLQVGVTDSSGSGIGGIGAFDSASFCGGECCKSDSGVGDDNFNYQEHLYHPRVVTRTNPPLSQADLRRFQQRNPAVALYRPSFEEGSAFVDSMSSVTISHSEVDNMSSEMMRGSVSEQEIAAGVEVKEEEYEVARADSPRKLCDACSSLNSSFDKKEEEGEKEDCKSTIEEEKAEAWGQYYNDRIVGKIQKGFVEPCVEVAVDVGRYWWEYGFGTVCPSFIKKRQLKSQMQNADNYAEWYSAALELDRLEGKHIWKREFESPYYDNELIEERLEDLRIARKSGDLRKMMFLLREGLHRNLGGIGNPQLYSHCHVGTKTLIERYIDEVVYQLNYICDTQSPEVSLEDKMEFFADTRQAFGRSALMLSGGGTFGAYHFGVLKCLHELKLLPRIVSGSSVGSLIASLLCVTPNNQLSEVLAFMRRDMLEKTGITRPLHEKLISLLKHGCLCDIKVLEECCRSVAGDITFQEAYNLTRNILNITVNSTGQYEMPRLLNYLTAPNVLIWSAACASCALTGLFQPVELMAKDSKGRIVPWNPSGQKWSDGSVESDLPMARLSELFDVNHFIVCQVNPHVVPFYHEKSPLATLFPSVRFIINSELQYRLKQLGELGVLPKAFISAKSLLSQRYQGDITIVPNMRLRDYLTVIGNPSDDYLRIAAKEGERSTWPKVSIIRNHCEIELNLDRVLYRLRQHIFERNLQRNGTNRESLKVSDDSGALSRRLKSSVY